MLLSFLRLFKSIFRIFRSKQTFHSYNYLESITVVRHSKLYQSLKDNQTQHKMSSNPGPSSSDQGSFSSEKELEDDPKAGLGTLHYHCLREIFAYLRFEDLVRLRAVSKRLSVSVSCYLPTRDSLALFMTSPMNNSAKRMYASIREGLRYHPLNYGNEYHLCTYGQSGKQFTEDITMLRNQNHFRHSDFIFLRSSVRYASFVNFIKKYNVNGLKKLAVLIDVGVDHISRIPQLLQFWPEVKVLFIDRTHHSLIDENRPMRTQIPGPKNEALIEALMELDQLEALYLFPKMNSFYSIPEENGLPSGKFQTFFDTMLNRLHTFHINFRNDFNRFPLPNDEYEKIIDLGIPEETFGKNLSVNFPNLRTCTIMQHSINKPDWNMNPFKMLTKLNVHACIDINTWQMTHLNSLPSIRELSARIIRIDCGMHCAYIDQETGERRPIPDRFVNRTIRRIEALTLQNMNSQYNQMFQNTGELQYLLTFKDFFPNLESCVLVYGFHDFPEEHEELTERSQLTYRELPVMRI